MDDGRIPDTQNDVRCGFLMMVLKNTTQDGVVLASIEPYDVARYMNDS